MEKLKILWQKMPPEWKRLGFWKERVQHARADALKQLSRVYLWGRVQYLKRQPAPVALDVPVVCVGNLVMGGAGKTPVALALGEMAKARGIPFAYLTRGYGGKLKGPVKVNARLHRARDVGDEPLLLAQVASTWVSHDRVAGARAAIEDGARAILMDDGFQNPSLCKDTAMLVFDGGVGIGNGEVIPAGPLREPFAEGVARATVAVIIGRDDTDIAKRLPENLPVIRAEMRPVAEKNTAFIGKRVIAFAGIGRPQKFFDMLKTMDVELVSSEPFADHHYFTREEMDRLMRHADRADAQLVTTAKDFVRVPAYYQDKVQVVHAQLHFLDETHLAALVFSA